MHTLQEPAGGAARFKAATDSFRTGNENEDPIVFFSGDILGPSIMSTFTKGEQMIPVLNHCKTACAVFGNHDFDYGLEVRECVMFHASLDCVPRSSRTTTVVVHRT